MDEPARNAEKQCENAANSYGCNDIHSRVCWFHYLLLIQPVYLFQVLS